MKPRQADLAACRALVASGTPTQRGLQASTLRDMGVGQVVQASRIEDVRRLIECTAFDIVLCDYHFDQSPMTGQDLLDELRDSQALPYATVFIMVTGEASYAMVAEAAESALDSYLLKPHTTAALAQRMLQARHRKQVLMTIFDAIEAGDLAGAAAIAKTRFEAHADYALTAARIAAELFIRLGDHAGAAGLYSAALQTQAPPWARLGLARTQLETGLSEQARATLEELLRQRPDCADVWDLLGRVRFEQGQLSLALEAYRSALRLTPQSVARLQRLGMLAMLQFDKLDACALTRTAENLRQKATRAPDDARLKRFVEIDDMLHTLNERTRSACALRAEVLSGSVSINTDTDADADFEAGANLLALLIRLETARVPITEMSAWVDAVAQRFGVCRISTELLAHAVQAREPYAGLVRASHARCSSVGGVAHGMSQGMKRNPLALGGAIGRATGALSIRV